MLIDDLRKLIKSGKLDDREVSAVTEAVEQCKRLDRTLEFLAAIESVAMAGTHYCKEASVMEVACELTRQMACAMP